MILLYVIPGLLLRISFAQFRCTPDPSKVVGAEHTPMSPEDRCVELIASSDGPGDFGNYLYVKPGTYRFLRYINKKVFLKLSPEVSQEAIITFPALTEVQQMKILKDDNLKAVEMNSLKIIQEDLRIEENAQLERVDLASLKDVKKHIKIVKNDRLESIELNSLSVIHNFLEVTNNAQLKKIRMEELTAVEWGVSIKENPSLESVELNKLGTIGGHLYFIKHAALQSIQFNSLVTIENYLTLTDNTKLTDINLNKLVEVQNNILIENLGVGVVLPYLTTFDSLSIQYSTPNITFCSLERQLTVTFPDAGGTRFPSSFFFPVYSDPLIRSDSTWWDIADAGLKLYIPEFTGRYMSGGDPLRKEKVVKLDASYKDEVEERCRRHKLASTPETGHGEGLKPTGSTSPILLTFSIIGIAAAVSLLAVFGYIKYRKYQNNASDPTDGASISTKSDQHSKDKKSKKSKKSKNKRKHRVHHRDG